MTTAQRRTRSQAASPVARHIRGLDGLRCLAVVLVVMSHAVKPGHFGGEIGVDVFFVLSGYLITTLILPQMESGVFRLSIFYGKRMIRLAPALVVVVVVCVPFGLFTVADRGRFLAEALSAFTYMTPVTKTLFGLSGSFGHTWTLGMEEYFYLAWPPILLLAWRRGVGRRAVLWGVLGAGVLGFFVKFMSDPTHAAPLGLLRVSGIAVGCGLAFILQGRESRIPLATFLQTFGVALIIVLAFVAGDGPFANLVYPLVCLVCAVTIAGIVGGGAGWVGALLGSGPAVYIGAISYEIYLVHYPTLALVSEALGFGANWSHVALWVIPLSLLLAALLHELLKPLQVRMRGRLLSMGAERSLARDMKSGDGE